MIDAEKREIRTEKIEVETQPDELFRIDHVQLMKKIQEIVGGYYTHVKVSYKEKTDAYLYINEDSLLKPEDKIKGGFSIFNRVFLENGVIFDEYELDVKYLSKFIKFLTTKELKDGGHLENKGLKYLTSYKNNK